MRLAFDPSGRHLLMAASGGVQLWSSDQGIARASLNDRWAGVSDIAFSPDGQRLASIAGVGRLWWIGASRIEHVLPFARNATMSAAIAFDPTGVLLALGSDSEIQVCDAASGDLVYTVPVRLAQSGGLSFTYDGSRLVAVSDTCVQIRRAADGVLVDTIDCADADDVVIAPDRSSLALVRGAEVAIWDLDSVTCRTPLAIPTTTYEVALAAGGRIMATATEAGIRVVRTDTGEQISYLPGHALRLALHPEGHILAAVYDRAINIYRVADGALLARATGHTDTITCLDFAPDTRHLASGSRDGTVRLWRYPGA
jgi:WD40 repeat protein